MSIRKKKELFSQLPRTVQRVNWSEGMVAVAVVELKTVQGDTYYVKERPLSVAEFASREHGAGDWVETTWGRLRFDQIVAMSDFLWHTYPEVLEMA